MKVDSQGEIAMSGGDFNNLLLEYPNLMKFTNAPQKGIDHEEHTYNAMYEVYLIMINKNLK